MDAVAMFPLGSVLFPYTPLVLRVFEPRYLTMMGRLLDVEDPEFGVVLIERGLEAGGGDQRAAGGERITVEKWREDDPHPVAEVSAMPALVWDDALEPLRREAERVVRRIATLASVVGEGRWDPDTPLSEDPVESSWQLAAISP